MRHDRRKEITVSLQFDMFTDFTCVGSENDEDPFLPKSCGGCIQSRSYRRDFRDRSTSRNIETILQSLFRSSYRLGECYIRMTDASIHAPPGAMLSYSMTTQQLQYHAVLRCSKRSGVRTLRGAFFESVLKPSVAVTEGRLCLSVDDTIRGCLDT